MRYINLATFFIVINLSSCKTSDQIKIYSGSESPIAEYTVQLLEDYFYQNGYSTLKPETKENTLYNIFIIGSENIPVQNLKEVYLKNKEGIKPEGYKIVKNKKNIYIIGGSDKGCLYGVTELLEQLGQSCQFSLIKEKQQNPALEFRAIKFNLPWAPYRSGSATSVHQETCRDLDFWESFLDMMVQNRFNALTLWSKHIFPFMIKNEKYPLATSFSDEELMEWKKFWKSLLKLAKNRGIETYLVNWNIVVSEEFAQNYGAEIHGDQSSLVIDYTKESVKQLINEYEDLTGLGVTLADWMGNFGEGQMSPKEREDWIQATFVEGMHEADRNIRFIHRAVLAGDPMEMRRIIDYANLPEKTIVEVKFNWSHGHSTPLLSITHANHQGTIMREFWDPDPENYFIAWMIRNEDFFVLRWGDPDFIKEHIKINNHDYVNGYFVGSEGYIPAKDYSHIDPHPHKSWNWAFEKQWLFYHLWGRLMYDPDETNETLAKAFERRYPEIQGKDLLKAFAKASKVPEYLASFYKGTWDFTLYCEGFLAPFTKGFDDEKSPFISLEEFIKHETLDPNYLSISKFCNHIYKNDPIPDELVTPFELADMTEEVCNEAMVIINDYRLKINEPTLHSELDDIETWCRLGYYFADKLRAGINFQLYELNNQQIHKEKSIAYLKECITHWQNVIDLTKDRYKAMPYASMGHRSKRYPDFQSFHWSLFTGEVEADLQFVMNH